MQKWPGTKKKYGFYIVVSAILFGFSHYYSLQYILQAISIGLVLGYMDTFYSKTPTVAFWSVALIHALRNTLAFILEFYDK
jgi:membrane protease YdiL (CAAX protease family)